MISQSLKAKVRRLYIDDEQGTFVPKPQHKLINWGCGAVPARLAGGSFFNRPDRVRIASNKLDTFNILKEREGVPIPEFTTSLEEARDWVAKGTIVVCRTKLNGHSGAGIVVAARPEEVVENCPLYVKYIKKIKEFRVHVAFEQVIDVQEKRKRKDFDGETNFAIRNHGTGWVYCREDIVEPANMREIAVQAILTLGLDFGAVDIIYNQHHNACYVLEVNTAPGLEGTTVEKYTNAFVDHLNNHGQGTN
jgi:glutathione synthase/RimK-type ligase-like ATP-grasp enzyme